MGRVCGSGCPYYGVDEDYNGYCKIDGNSYRERFSNCNMGYGDSSSESSTSSSGGGGCFKWLVIIAVIIGIGYSVFNVTLPKKATEAPAQSQQGQTAYTTAEINLRKEPSTSGGKIMVLPDNARVTIVKQEGAWSYVQYNEHEGWCKTEFLKIQ